MTALRWLGLLLFGLYLAVGIGWGGAHLGEVPHYGDTLEYLELASKLRTYRFRGFLYPWVLRGTCRILLNDEVPRQVSFKEEEKAEGPRPCAVPPEFAFVQVLQILVSVAGLAYFLHVVWPRREGGRSPPLSGLAPWIVVVLLVFDPLVLHYNLSLMTDGLATSGALVFCAALADLGLGRSRPAVAAILLFLSGFLCAGLRVEKKWILLATAAATVVVWASWKRWRREAVSRDLIRRSVGAVLLVVLTMGLVVAVQQRSSDDRKSWWSLEETVLHSRLVFRHLSEVYDGLSETTRTLISREDAALYDRHLNNVRPVVNRATKNDATLRHHLTRDFVRTVLSRRWKAIAVDVVRDTLENVFVTVPFYVRVGIWLKGGYKAVDESFDSGVAVWNFTRLEYHHKALAGGTVLLFAAVFLACLPVALREAWRFVRGGRWEAGIPWIPALLFWMLNALSFSLATNYINLRYMIASHVLFLGLVYGAGVRWWMRGR